MSSGLIFITGATGFIGGTTAKAALQSGYRLRVSVRQDSQIEKLKGVFSNYLGRIEFIVVPDITSETAFAGKLEGVDYVFHLASPLPKGIDKQQFFPPAVKGTTAILKEATKVPSIKKVVITSSIAALLPVGGLPHGGVIKENNDWDVCVDENADFIGDTDMMTAIRLYQASKILANQARWKFMETEKPKFTLVTIHPSFVYGHNVMQITAGEGRGGTNGQLWDRIMSGTPSGNITYVYVGDVAAAHVKALDPRITESTSYLVSGPPATWKDVVDILKRDYPEIPYKIKADTPGASWPTDTTKAVTELRMKWTSLEKIVHEVMDQQLRFLSVDSSNI
ncbi:probable 3-beta hydroxysteroid dehydrogenase/isomerase [Phialocephala subalpina]|uniref:Probable 3-beta hydroxysteroid dehydrogenase/isomerase n=1 Tax=Phialocephala subalpina TaxID=576137 RepID=A0A1L7XJF8_9HELO|nr:probable 3-beta hydroxysteroid dehydrogenase/isomerase [Phialocephala subalpina]